MGTQNFDLKWGYRKISRLTHLCPGKNYWADFYNFLHMNPSDDQMTTFNFLRKNVQKRTCGHKWVKMALSMDKVRTGILIKILVQSY